MKYLVINPDSINEIARGRISAYPSGAPHPIDDLESDIDSSMVSWSGQGAEIDYEAFVLCRQNAEKLASSSTSKLDKDQSEGKVSVELFQTISSLEVPYTALADPGFWGYLSLAIFWNFIIWRQESAFTVDSDGNSKPAFSKYVTGATSRECVPSRMFLRMTTLGGSKHSALAYAVKGGTDFWRSHILRVGIGDYPNIVRSMVNLQKNKKTHLDTKHLREFAKDLTATIENLVPDILDETEADKLIKELWLPRLPNPSSIPTLKD